MAVGVVLAGTALVVNPFNHADAAQNPQRAAFRKCVNQGQQDRNKAQNQFTRAVRAARELPQAQRQAAIEAAQNAFRTAAQKANTDFQACVDAIPDPA